MRLPDGTILMHEGRAYDPIKAHEYYLKVRKLKGRRPAAAEPPHGLARQPANNNPQLRKQRADAAARVASLRKKLSQLHEALKAKMDEEAKAKKSKKDKPVTAADKSKKAREAKKYRDSHKQKLKTEAKKTDDKKAAGSTGGSGGDSSKQPAKKSSGGSVKELKAAIATVQRSLAAAVARQRALG